MPFTLVAKLVIVKPGLPTLEISVNKPVGMVPRQLNRPTKARTEFALWRLQEAQRNTYFSNEEYKV